MTQLLVIDADRLAAFEAKLDTVLAALSQINPPPDWVPIKDAAARLGCSESTVYRRIGNGELVARGAGRMKRVRVG